MSQVAARSFASNKRHLDLEHRSESDPSNLKASSYSKHFMDMINSSCSQTQLNKSIFRAHFRRPAWVTHIVLSFVSLPSHWARESRSYFANVECAPRIRLRIRDLNLYRATLRVCASLKRTNGILDRKPMRHQLPDIAQHASLHEPNRLGKCVVILVLLPEDHLPRQQPLDRVAYLALPDADDEHGPARPDHLDRGPDGRLLSRALQYDVRLRAPHRLRDPRRELIGRLFGRYAQCAHASGC